MLLAWFRVEQVGAQDGYHGERDKKGSRHADDGGNGDRGKKPSLDAAQSEQRNENEDDQHGGVEDRRPHFGRSQGDNLEFWFGLLGGGIFPEASKDIFHIDDGVVHHHTDGDGKAAEGHGVYGKPEKVEDNNGHRQRQRNGCQGDEGDAEVEQKEKEHHRDHDGAVEQGLLEVADSDFDEVRLTVEHHRFGTGRQSGLQFLDFFLHCASQADGVEAG